MSNEYPRPEELEKIENWPFEDVLGLIEYIQGLWWMPEWGFEYKPKSKKLELHTGGWSGNEDIIRALMHTSLWVLYWEKTIRGGHYYFKGIKNPGPKCDFEFEVETEEQ